MISTHAITNKKYRKELLHHLISSEGWNRNTAVSLIVSFWQSGFCLKTLYPRYNERGRHMLSTTITSPPVISNDNQLENFFWNNVAIRETPTIQEAYTQYRIKYYLKPGIPNSTYYSTNGDIFTKNCPTYDYFYTRLSKWINDNYIQVMINTNGRIEYNLKYLDVLGRNDYPPLAPGCVFLLILPDAIML